jgi:hypothetical protein
MSDILIFGHIAKWALHRVEFFRVSNKLLRKCVSTSAWHIYIIVIVLIFSNIELWQSQLVISPYMNFFILALTDKQYFAIITTWGLGLTLVCHFRFQAYLAIKKRTLHKKINEPFSIPQFHRFCCGYILSIIVPLKYECSFYLIHFVFCLSVIYKPITSGQLQSTL